MAEKGKDLAELYLSERKRLERQIDRKVGCRSTASDLVQDIFLRLWEKTVEWKGDSAAYLSRCARNAAIDHLRAEKTRQAYLKNELPDQFCEPPLSPQEILTADQNFRHIKEVLASLPEKTRHIFLLNGVRGPMMQKTTLRV